jgi:predicted kinase
MFARQFARIKKYKIIDLDEIKTSLVGPNIPDNEITQTDWDRIYQNMYTTIETSLKSNSVIHDTGNFTQYERILVRRIAVKKNIDFSTIYINTPIKIARNRLLLNRKHPTRFDVSDSDFDAAIAEIEEPRQSEHSLIYNGTENVTEWLVRNRI